jgi:hypothetical protein
MSFYNARGGGICPGAIEGNPLSGLRHRVAVCVERVLDSCMKQESAERVHLRLFGITPENPQPPFKFTSALSSHSEAQVTDLTITRLERPEFARVTCNVLIPMCVNFEDSRGEKFCARTHLIVAQDVIMYVPRNSIFPFQVKATASVNSAEGKITEDCSCIATLCYTIIIKITADTDLLIPTYGFCKIPNAVDYTHEECNEIFDLPLYPSGR